VPSGGQLSNRDRRRSWRVLTLWVAAIEILIVLALFSWRWALPAQSARVVVARYHADDRADFKKAVRELGGPSEAARKLALYFKLPERLAPHRLTAAEMLDECGKHALGALMEIRHDPDWKVREAVVRAMIDIDDPRLVWPLIGALRDGDDDVRSAAAHALGSRRDPRAVGPLIEMIENDLSSISLIAGADALGEFKDRRAVAPLKRLLDNDERYVRIAALEALKEMGVEAQESPRFGVYGFRDSSP